MNKYYKILGLKNNATKQEIKDSYRKLAKKYHPDLNGDKNATVKFREISDAYNYLINNNEKDLSDNFKFNGFNTIHNFTNYSDLFNSMYDLNKRTIKTEIILTFSDVYYGTNKYINVKNEQYKIKINQGVKNKQILKYKLLINNIETNVNVKVKLIIDKNLIINDLDVFYTIDITIFDILFGNDILVEFLNEKFKLTIKERTSSNKKYRLKGKGLQKYKTNLKGDLYILLNVIIPSNLDVNSKEIQNLKKYLNE